MAFDPTYDSAKSTGSAGTSITDLNPEEQYGLDARFLDSSEKRTYAAARSQGDRLKRRVRRSLSAAKAAGKFQKGRMIDPYKGKVPASELREWRGQFGRAGATNYSEKPKAFAGKRPEPYGYNEWGDAF